MGIKGVIDVVSIVYERNKSEMIGHDTRKDESDAVK